jgi:RNA polymerase sigma-70 factor, ECF subfamily
MLLHDSRREARFAGNKHGQDLVLLPDQDRSRWDWQQIAEGRALLHQALGQAASGQSAGSQAAGAQPAGGQAAGAQPAGGQAAGGPYVIQAAIASLQTQERLDWPQISVLYAKLAELTGSPVVRLNRAVAVAEADGPAAALAIVDQLDLPDYQYWHSTRAELLRRLGRPDEARAAYRRALALARTAPERRFLERRIAES